MKNDQIEKFDILRTASELSHPGYGAWLFDTWADHNECYFDGVLDVIPIIWGLTPHGASLGYYSPGIRRITMHESLIDPSGDNPWGIGGLLGQAWASDVLLHEMMHQHIYQRDGGHPHGHNHPQWTDEINRVAALLGLPTNAAVVKQKRVKPEGAAGKGKVTRIVEQGNMTIGEMASWPHTARNPHHYRPEYYPAPEEV